ncbi:MAG: 4Fe-4S binding protein [Ectothiorhodospiraceae bacterium]|nr:4Fe-4S binding protein [Ectothiorhodospiraceae bacterium]MCH8506336.1 4Fe-4S binding protein [Ectothiorhodospiraceae bacterium]
MMPEKRSGKPGLEERYQVVHPSEPRLRIDISACLPARSPLADCTACADACPASVLTGTAQGPQLNGDCLGCGRCAARCPTDALRVRGFPDLPLPDEASPRIREVDCWRVPESESRADTLRVPCTGGLDATQMLSLNRMAGGEGVTVLDRGWCTGCPACGNEGHPAHEAIREAGSILDEAGIPRHRHPRISTEPLPVRVAAKTIPEGKLESRVSRRGFLRRLGGEAISARAQLTGSTTPTVSSPLVEKIRPRRRLRLYEELTALTGQGHTPATLPRFSVSETCQGHGICAALCPTGALRHQGDHGTRTLFLEATLCIACRLCEQSCPEQAIRVEASVGGEANTELHRLTELRCRDCGRVFTTGNDSEERCHPCRKSRHLMNAELGSVPRIESTTGEGSR